MVHRTRGNRAARRLGSVAFGDALTHSALFCQPPLPLWRGSAGAPSRCFFSRAPHLATHLSIGEAAAAAVRAPSRSALPFPSLIRATPLSRILTTLPIAAALAAMASKKVDETTTLKGTDDPDDKNLPEWVVKYGAPLAITFYILVAVVKTMLTKVRLGTSALAVTMRRAHGLLRAGSCSCLAGPLRGWRGVPCRLLRHLGRRHVRRARPRLPLRSHTVGSAQEGLHAWCAKAMAARV